ncbi:UNVERIFIED_CONTAM: Mitochondrial metalloendopeptidase OMA1 [Sesamum angustifolium]|uniref:Mitochondrial metalloendopeptidase OMA1 n=1 Tax=Sesamum angustifolium TaxID=2727405 RepID=A0AAW2LF62_9LAMI
MGWYRRSPRLIFDALRTYTSKIVVPRNPIQESISRTNFFRRSLQPNFSRPRVPEISQQFFKNSSLHNGLNQIQRKSPFLDGAKRNYEKELGESQFKQIKAQFKGKILPPLHPDSIRVQSIAQDIIDALQKGLRKEQVWSDIRYSPESAGFPHEADAHETMRALGDRISEDEKWQSEDKWHKEGEILDDQWVQESRKKGQEMGRASQTGHLEGLKWEVIVVNEPVINAFCLPGGKIVVFTGLLDHFKADTEIATIIGHEVGHAVARHSAEQISKNLWLTILQLILYQFFMPDIVNTMSHLFLRLPFSRRMEMEADYIGLLLVASAGYDPRVAPQVYEKLGRVVGDSALQDYLATHPSGKKRAQVLAQAKVMQEALDMYREVQAGRGRFPVVVLLW